MIITSLMGGLGNQLFQYAMAKRLAEHHKTELCLDVSGYGSAGEKRPEGLAAFRRKVGLFHFRISARAASPDEIIRLRDPFFSKSPQDRLVRIVRRIWPRFLWRRTHVVERQYRFLSEALQFPDQIYLQGFWQSEKYFSDIEGIIRQEFELRDETVLASAQQSVQALKEKYGQVVSLHVRRGDLAFAFETLGSPQMVHGTPVSLEYINKAISYFDPQTCFFVFSDSANDIEWCKRYIKAERAEFSRAESDVWDFVAMRHCDHHIIANSTFSWWAAWLDQKACKKVIAPRVWSSPGARIDMAIEDLIPASWVVV